MKWIGQHIWDFISRFRNDVYLESVGTSSETNVLVVDSDGKITKNTAMAGDITGVTAGDGLTDGGTSGTVTLNVGAGTGIDVAADAISVDVSDFMTNGGDDRVVTATGADAMNAESMLKFSGTTLDIGSSADHIASLQFTNDENAFTIGVSNATNGGMIGTADGDVFINSAGDHNVCIGQNNTTNLKIDTDGDVVVSNNLDVTGTITGNVTGNASTATALATARAINGVDFDGTAAITVPAAGSTLSDTVPVSKGGTGATTLGDTNILIGDGASAVETTSSLTYSSAGELFSIGDSDNGRAEIVRTNGNDSGGGQLRITGGRALNGGTSNLTGGDLELVGGAGVGDGASGGVRFYNWNTVGSGNSPQTTINEIASITGAGNLQIDGGLTTGSTSAINSSGLIQVANQSNITGVGTISSGTWQGTVIASDYLDTDTAHLSGTQTFSGTKTFSNTISGSIDGNAETATTAKGITGTTDGDVTITSDGHVVVKLDADNDESNQRFKITDNSDATVFHVQEDGNVLLAGTIITNSSSGNDLTLETDGSLTFTIDRDNNETSQKFSFVNYNAEVANIDESGNLQIDGDLTVDGNNITNNASATNFNISSSRILELQHAGSYDIQLGNSTNADVLRVAGDSEVVTVNGNLTVNGDSVTFESANADDPIFTLKNTSNDTNDAAQMIFIKDRGAAPAVGTNLGEVRFQGEDSGQNPQEYGGFLCEIDVAADGQESGQFGIWVATHDGESQYGLQLTGGDAEDKVNVAIGQGAASLTTIAGDLQVNGDDIKDSSGNANTLPGVAGTLQHQGEKTGQYLQIKIKDLNSYMFYMYNDDSWYSAGSGTLAILGSSTAPSAISSANSEYQSRTACYTAIADCTVKKLQLTFYWSSSVVSAADIDFAFSKFTPITDGTAADITMNAITATDHNGSYTENKPYQKTFTFSGGNASLSAGDALGFHMRTTGGSSAQRIFIYGTAILSVELD